MTDQLLRQGVRRLRAWLPAARAAVARADWQWRETSAIAKGMLPHISEDRLRAVCIYPAPLGGWHADIVLKNMPPGVPDVVGTPVGLPKATREEAEATARDLLQIVLATARQNATGSQHPAPPPAFILYGHPIRLAPALLAEFAATRPGQATSSDRKAFALGLIAGILDEVGPEGFDGTVFLSWSPSRRAELLAAFHLAALAGVMRYPPLEPASPSGHGKASEAVH